MSKIYENIYIGNFIFACGKYTGAKEENGSVNLYQQTPSDKYIGDLMVSSEARHFIIEFKATEADLVTELHKPKRINLEKNLEEYTKMYDSSELERISAKAHFLAFPDKSFQLSFYPYYDYFSIRRKNEHYSFNTFIQEFYSPEERVRRGLFDLLDTGPKVGVNTSDFWRYINFLNQDNNKDVSGSIGGLMISVSKDKQMLLVPFKGIEELHILLRMPILAGLAVETLEKIREEVQVKAEELKDPPQQIQIQS